MCESLLDLGVIHAYPPSSQAQACLFEAGPLLTKKNRPVLAAAIVYMVQTN